MIWHSGIFEIISFLLVKNEQMVLVLTSGVLSLVITSQYFKTILFEVYIKKNCIVESERCLICIFWLYFLLVFEGQNQVYSIYPVILDN